MLALPAVIVTALLAVQTPLHTFHGDSAGDEFGVAAAFAGDANRDGYADILVGAHWDDDFGNNSGSARLFSGLDGSVLATFHGNAAGDFFGLSVSDVGDVDGDGFDDFAVGADGADANGTDSGLVRVFAGQGGVIRNIPGSTAGEKLGTALAAVRDSAHSILVGAPSSNLARVVDASTGTTTWTFFGAAPGDGFGTAVASGRDLTGDGVPDFAIGAPNDDVGGADSGSVAIFSGATGALIRTLRGQAAGDRFGASVALIPDSDGDGRAEIVVGAPRADGPGSDAGAVYVFSGASGSLVLSRSGEASGDQFGSSVACVSTLTGNPQPVFLVGARLNDVAGNNAGAAYSHSALSGSLLGTYRGHAAGDWFGGTVAGGDDVNGDGLGDFIATARLSDVNGSDSGSVEVHASPLVPATWYVDASVAGPGSGTQADPYRSIQYAVNRSTTRSGDSIMVAPGNYLENVVIDSKVLRISGNGIGNPVLDGQQQTSTLTILGNPRKGTILDGLTIQNGMPFNHDPMSVDDYYGGGIYSPNSSIELRNCVITDNEAHFMGTFHGIGAYLAGPRILLDGTVITRNAAEGGWSSYNGADGGGGVNVIGESVQITDCVISANFSEGNGGGLSVLGRTALLHGCSIIDNHAGSGGDYGGGIYARADSLRIEACEISRNSSRDYGAGIAVLSGQVVIRDCLIDGNESGEGSYDGGGVYAKFPGTRLEGCVVSNNATATGAGTAGPVVVSDTSFIGNSAVYTWSGTPYYCGRGGAMFGGTAIRCLFDSNDFFGALGSSNCPGSVAVGATLVQCTVVRNSAPTLPGYYGSTFDNCSLDSCIVWSNQGIFGDALTTASYSDIESGWPGVGNIASDPLFQGQPQGDFHLTALSPCIDTGNPSLPNDPDGSRADMGAYPYDPNYCPPPFSYCTAKTNSCRAVPAIGSAGVPSAGATSGFTISATGARTGKLGLLMYSPNGQWSSSFQGGTLCIAPQGLRRGPPVAATGGTGGAACDAMFTIDWAVFASGGLGGTPPAYLRSVGQRVNVQWWGRDSVVTGSFLSDALQYEVCP